MAGCDGPSGALGENFGVVQVQITDIHVDDSMSVGDTLFAILTGRPVLGNCASLSRADVIREESQVTIALWANSRLWVGTGPPPPCGSVGYSYEGLPPFNPGFYRVVGLQPDSSTLVESVLVVERKSN
jgi:hypothetical protein